MAQGDPYITCDKQETFEEILAQLIVEDTDGNAVLKTC